MTGLSLHRRIVYDQEVYLCFFMMDEFNKLSEAERCKFFKVFEVMCSAATQDKKQNGELESSLLDAAKMLNKPSAKQKTLDGWLLKSKTADQSKCKESRVQVEVSSIVEKSASSETAQTLEVYSEETNQNNLKLLFNITDPVVRMERLDLTNINKQKEIIPQSKQHIVDEEQSSACTSQNDSVLPPLSSYNLRGKKKGGNVAENKSPLSDNKKIRVSGGNVAENKSPLSDNKKIRVSEENTNQKIDTTIEFVSKRNLRSSRSLSNDQKCGSEIFDKKIRNCEKDSDESDNRCSENELVKQSESNCLIKIGNVAAEGSVTSDMLPKLKLRKVNKRRDSQSKNNLKNLSENNTSVTDDFSSLESSCISSEFSPKQKLKTKKISSKNSPNAINNSEQITWENEQSDTTISNIKTDNKNCVTDDHTDSFVLKTKSKNIPNIVNNSEQITCENEESETTISNNKNYIADKLPDSIVLKTSPIKKLNLSAVLPRGRPNKLKKRAKKNNQLENNPSSTMNSEKFSLNSTLRTKIDKSFCENECAQQSESETPEKGDVDKKDLYEETVNQSSAQYVLKRKLRNKTNKLKETKSIENLQNVNNFSSEKTHPCNNQNEFGKAGIVDKNKNKLSNLITRKTNWKNNCNLQQFTDSSEIIDDDITSSTSVDAVCVNIPCENQNMQLLQDNALGKSIENVTTDDGQTQAFEVNNLESNVRDKSFPQTPPQKKPRKRKAPNKDEREAENVTSPPSKRNSRDCSEINGKPIENTAPQNVEIAENLEHDPVLNHGKTEIPKHVSPQKSKEVSKENNLKSFPDANLEGPLKAIPSEGEIIFQKCTESDAFIDEDNNVENSKDGAAATTVETCESLIKDGQSLYERQYEAYCYLRKSCASHGLVLDDIFHTDKFKSMVEKYRNKSDAIVFIGTRTSENKVEPTVHVHASKKQLYETLSTMYSKNKSNLNTKENKQ